MSKAKRYQLSAFAFLFVASVGLFLMQRDSGDLFAYVAIAAGVMTVIFSALALITSRKVGRDNG